MERFVQVFYHCARAGCGDLKRAFDGKLFPYQFWVIRERGRKGREIQRWRFFSIVCFSLVDENWLNKSFERWMFDKQ